MAVYALIDRYTGKRIAAYGAVESADGNRFEVGRLHQVKGKTYRVEALVRPTDNGQVGHSAEFEVVVERLH